jgi:hypothetical protein
LFADEAERLLGVALGDGALAFVGEQFVDLVIAQQRHDAGPCPAAGGFCMSLE